MSEYSLPHSARAAPIARQLAERVAGSRISPGRTDDLLLMVTEAVTNAVRHAPPVADDEIRLRFETDEGVVRTFVTDGGSWFVSGANGNGERGLHFGLKIIDALSRRWGITVDGVKTLWFEVEAREAQEPAKRQRRIERSDRMSRNTEPAPLC
jgi:anti-sigma regulatory factor (Ser/Thr protein kinase)